MYTRKTEEEKGYNRKSWLQSHPWDQWIDDENQIARRKGYDNEDVRQLFAAICLRCCVDYKNASLGKYVDRKPPDEVMEDCRKFFKSGVFQYFVNRIPVEEIEQHICETPKEMLHNIWHKSEDNSQKIQGLL